MESTEAIRHRELSNAEPLIFRVIGVIAATQIIGGFLLLLSDPEFPRWRAYATFGLGVVTVILGGMELLIAGPSKRNRWLDILLPSVSIVVFGVMIAVVEGPASPMSALLFHVVIGQASRQGRSLSSVISIAATLVVLGVLVALPQSWFGPDLASPQRDWLWVLVLGGVALSQFGEVSVVRRAYDRAAHQVDNMRDSILRDNEARVRGLEAIGARVAHELKNPLTSLKALLQLSGTTAEVETDKKRFEVMCGEVERMHAIIQDYLSFSRPLDALRPRPLDVRELARHTAAVLEARAKKGRVDLVVAGDSVEIIGDRERLRGALLNVMGNAIEATPAGGTVGIEVRKTGDGARIHVRDTGKGMEEADLAMLGTPFFTKRPGGTGLGVVVASTTIRQHGGTIDFESAMGEGTTVKIHLPRDAHAEDPTQSYENLANLDVAALDRARKPA